MSAPGRDLTRVTSAFPEVRTGTFLPADPFDGMGGACTPNWIAADHHRRPDRAYRGV
jgi:hypothetical protein